MHKALSCWTLAKKSTITVAYYANLLDQLRTVIREKRRGKLSKGILLQLDNARVHTCKTAMDTVERNGYELIPHPAYSPDLAPSDYFLFPNLKKNIRGRHFRPTKKSWRQLRSASETKTLASSVLGWWHWNTVGQRALILEGNYIKKKRSISPRNKLGWFFYWLALVVKNCLFWSDGLEVYLSYKRPTGHGSFTWVT